MIEIDYQIGPHLMEKVVLFNKNRITLEEAIRVVKAGEYNDNVLVMPKKQFVSLFKRICNRRCGENIWQRSYHDHILRSEADYLRVWEYMDTNPAKWREDCFYCE